MAELGGNRKRFTSPLNTIFRVCFPSVSLISMAAEPSRWPMSVLQPNSGDA